MATIKLQPSGAVVLKDGKVACACCEQPSECCMYPARLIGLSYQNYDLPETLKLNTFGESGTLTHTANTSEYAGAQGVGGYASYRIINPDNVTWVLQRETGALGDGDWEEAGESLCLITGDGNLTPGNDLIEDQFADSYMITPNVGDSASPTVVTRISLCLWRGTDTCGNFVYLSYGLNPDGGQDIMWNVFFRFYTPTCVIDGQVDGQKNEDEFENTPVGTYSGTFEDSAFVS